MFDTGLSETLVECLRMIADSISDLKKVVQTRLLHKLSMVLRSSPFEHPGTVADISTRLSSASITLPPVPPTAAVPSAKDQGLRGGGWGDGGGARREEAGC